MLKCYIFMLDTARKRSTNTERHGNITVFVWAYQIKCTCFKNNFFSFTTSKITEKVNLPKRLLAKLQPFFVDVNDNCLDVANLYSVTIKPSTKTCVF